MTTSTTLSLVAALALWAMTSTASTTTAITTSTARDPHERNLERAFLALDSGPRGHARALRLFAAAAEDFDDVTLDASALERAYVSDPKKPYRGRPHEQLAVWLTLAALDLERGRSDLALPSLQAARLLADKRHVDDADDVIDALRYVAFVREHDAGRATGAEVDAARAGLSPALRAAVSDPSAVLRLRGYAPTLTSSGTAGEATVLSARAETRAPIVIALGARGRARVAAADIDVDVHAAFDVAAAAAATKARAFDQELGNRAAERARQQSEAQRSFEQSRAALGSGGLGSVAAAGVFGIASAGHATVAAVTDARADVRVVDTAPQLIELGVAHAPQKAKSTSSKKTSTSPARSKTSTKTSKKTSP